MSRRCVDCDAPVSKAATRCFPCWAQGNRGRSQTPEHKARTMLGRLGFSDPVERFHSLYERRGPGECWPWRSTINHRYGVVTWNGRAAMAHRVAATLAGLEVQPGHVVMHTCDNPPCVNPAHLRVGTQADNTRDMAEKGRSTWGRTKLDRDAIAYVRRERAVGRTTFDLAAELGVSHSTISRMTQRAAVLAERA